VARPVPTATSAPVDPALALPGPDAVPGWAPAAAAQTYDSTNLFNLVDGAAEGYLAYGFRQVAVGSYGSGDTPGIKVEIWQLGSPADAYGLYSTAHFGEPVSLGNEGALNPGNQVTFWQNAYLVRVRSLATVTDADLQKLAGAAAAALPKGGAKPALLSRLPAADRVADSEMFFRQELSIQDRVWLGGVNVLQLGSDTEGVLADYTLAGAAEPVTLVLVRYPDVARATSALAALQAGQVENLLAERSSAEMLSAVFGTAEPSSAEQLLAR
jgi:hypothetical protein